MNTIGRKESPRERGRPTIFLDVDGVLNRCADSGFGLESDKLRLLGEIYDETLCRIVLSSSWRNYPDQLVRLREALRDRGLVLYSRTPDLTTTPDGCRIARAKPRFEEIQAWLATAPETGLLVILDDERDFGPLASYHVQTQSNIGLTPAIAAEVIARLTHPTP